MHPQELTPVVPEGCVECGAKVAMELIEDGSRMRHWTANERGFLCPDCSEKHAAAGPTDTP